MRIALIALAASALLAGTTVAAGPDQTINELMDEPASMLDLGLVKVQLHLNQNEPNPFIEWFASYNWDDNTIDFTTFLFSEVELEEAKKTCKSMIARVREEAGFNRDGEVNTGVDNSHFAQYFNHTGWQFGTNEEVQKRLEDLDTKFRIKIRNLVSIEGDVGQLNCTARLPGTSFATEVKNF